MRPAKAGHLRREEQRLHRAAPSAPAAKRLVEGPVRGMGDPPGLLLQHQQVEGRDAVIHHPKGLHPLLLLAGGVRSVPILSFLLPFPTPFGLQLGRGDAEHRPYLFDDAPRQVRLHHAREPRPGPPVCIKWIDRSVGQLAFPTVSESHASSIIDQCPLPPGPPVGKRRTHSRATTLPRSSPALVASKAAASPWASALKSALVSTCSIRAARGSSPLGPLADADPPAPAAGRHFALTTSGRQGKDRRKQRAHGNDLQPVCMSERVK